MTQLFAAIVSYIGNYTLLSTKKQLIFRKISNILRVLARNRRAGAGRNGLPVPAPMCRVTAEHTSVFALTRYAVASDSTGHKRRLMGLMGQIGLMGLASLEPMTGVFGLWLPPRRVRGFQPRTSYMSYMSYSSYCGGVSAGGLQARQRLPLPHVTSSARTSAAISSAASSKSSVIQWRAAKSAA